MRSNTRTAVIRDYDGEIDVFLIYCPDNGGVYAVPVEEAARSETVLRLGPTSNGQQSGVRWAEQYHLPA